MTIRIARPGTIEQRPERFLRISSLAKRVRILCLALSTLLVFQTASLADTPSATIDTSNASGDASSEVQLSAATKAFLDNDFKKAQMLSYPLAERGLADAQYLYAIILRSQAAAKGSYAAHEMDEMRGWFRRAANQGHAGAEFAHGYWALDELDMTEKTRNEAVRSIIVAAEKGLVSAQRNLLIATLADSELRSYRSQATPLAKRAAANGSAIAAFMLGWNSSELHLKGGERLHYLRTAAVAGVYKAQLTLGLGLANSSTATGAEIKEAKFWLRVVKTVNPSLEGLSTRQQDLFGEFRIGGERPWDEAWRNLSKTWTDMALNDKQWSWGRAVLWCRRHAPSSQPCVRHAAIDHESCFFPWDIAIATPDYVDSELYRRCREGLFRQRDL